MLLGRGIGQRKRPPRVPGQRANFGPFIRLPDLDRSGGIGDGDFLIVGMNGHGGDGPPLFGIGLNQHPGVRIVQPCNLVFTASDDSRPIELESECCYRARVSLQIPQGLLIAVVPQATRLVGGTGRDHRVIRIDS